MKTILRMCDDDIIEDMIDNELCVSKALRVGGMAHGAFYYILRANVKYIPIGMLLRKVTIENNGAWRRLT